MQVVRVTRLRVLQSMQHLRLYCNALRLRSQWLALNFQRATPRVACLRNSQKLRAAVGHNWHRYTELAAHK